MIHKIFSLFFILILPSVIFGQFETNKNHLGPSVGFSFLGSTIQFGLNHEYGISLEELGIDKVGKLGIGGVFRYWDYKENFPNVEWDYTDILVGIQTNYHFYMANDKVDPWAGLIIAYDFNSVNSKIKTVGYEAIEESYGGLWIGAQAGARYWFNKDMAISIRIGFGTINYGSLDLGFDYKFN